MKLTSHVFNEVIQNYKSCLCDRGKKLKIHEIIASQGKNTYRHSFSAEDTKVELWSVTKPFLAVLVGILIEKQTCLLNEKISLETKIFPLLKTFTKCDNSTSILFRNIKISHLLSHTSGFAECLMFSKLKKHEYPQILNWIIQSDLKDKPGTKFKYTNAGGYLLSAILQEHLKQSLDQLIKHHLFDYLGISDFQWTKLGKYCAGATGLNLSASSVHKLGLLMISKGRYKGKQIISEEWINKMTSPQTLTTELYDKFRVLPKYAFGYNLYICKDGTCFSDSINGHYLIINFDSNLVIAITANQKNTKPVTECLIPLIGYR